MPPTDVTTTGFPSSAASGALILGLLKRRLTWDLIKQAVQSTAKLSAFVVFILIYFKYLI